MTIIKSLFLIYSLSFNISIFAVDYGNSSDGICNLNVAIDTDIKDTYNCSSVSISNISVTGSKALTIKSQGPVTISGTISLDGGNGGNGLDSAASTAGVAGSGGFAGGHCSVGNVAGNAGLSGGNNGEGLGGSITNHFGAGDAGGAGGGGARYGTEILPTSGADGEDDLGNPISGGDAGTNSYGPESNFESLFIGGSGGGAGSSGVDNGSGNTHSGGAGGGGGGAIHITAKEDIVVEVTGGISANGGDGGDGSGNVSGGGGAGSGGAIFLQAEGAVIINGTVSAVGGSGGDGTFAASDNDGGNGGSGRVRYDDGDGILTGTGTTTPTAVVNTISISSTSPIQTTSYDSSIACGSIGLSEEEKSVNVLLSLFIVFLISYIVSKKSQYI